MNQKNLKFDVETLQSQKKAVNMTFQKQKQRDTVDAQMMQHTLGQLLDLPTSLDFIYNQEFMQDIYRILNKLIKKFVEQNLQYQCPAIIKQLTFLFQVTAEQIYHDLIEKSYIKEKKRRNWSLETDQLMNLQKGMIKLNQQIEEKVVTQQRHNKSMDSGKIQNDQLCDLQNNTFLTSDMLYEKRQKDRILSARTSKTTSRNSSPQRIECRQYFNQIPKANIPLGD